MKKLVLVFAMIFATMTFAQTNLSKSDVATSQGTYVLGLNATNIGFTNVEKDTKFGVGLNLGAFVQDRLALVGKVGYGSSHFEGLNTNNWTYGAGVKYYLAGILPLQVDWNGATGNSYKPSASYVGTQVGFALFPFDNFSVEPRVRYDISTQKQNYPNVFSGGLDFNLFF